MVRSFVSLLFVSGLVVANGTNTGKNLSFGIINGGSSYFEPIQHGFEKKCRDHGVTCHYRIAIPKPEGPLICESHRIELVREFISLKVDGIAMKPCGDEHMRLIIREAEEAGIPVVTFDSDVSNSSRKAYIGTDNVFLGRTMARLLKQLRPEGGTFAIVGQKAERVEGFTKEITKDNDRDNRAHWYEVERNFSLAEVGKENFFIDQMELYASLNPSAMVFMYQTPMRNPNWTDFVDAHRHRNMTYIGVDGSDFQLSYLSQRYVDGLVGQLPYEIGSRSFDVLYEVVTKGTVEKTNYPTNLVAYNLIPLELPPVDVDQNLLGNLKYIGYICFAVAVISALACMAWTYRYRACIIVRTAQPFFLIMVAAGVLIMSSALVPLSFDDGGDPESMSTTRRVGICMTIPWLASTGFTVTFSALFSKTWRVNRLFKARTPHARIQVSEKDVLAPFVVLLTCNFIVLICWTVIDPLTYTRELHAGTDFWNREIESSGSCQSDKVLPYLVPLAMVNLGAVAIACWQAIRARDIKSEFSEAIYIGLAVFSMAQAFLTGIPIVAVVRNMPEAFYVVLTFMIFVLCMAVLLLIFLPKFFMKRSFACMSESEQRKAIRSSIRKSSGGSSQFALAAAAARDSFAREAGISDMHIGGADPALSVLKEEDSRISSKEMEKEQSLEAHEIPGGSDAFVHAAAALREPFTNETGSSDVHVGRADPALCVLEEEDSHTSPKEIDKEKGLEEDDIEQH